MNFEKHKCAISASISYIYSTEKNKGSYNNQQHLQHESLFRKKNV